MCYVYLSFVFLFYITFYFSGMQGMHFLERATICDEGLYSKHKSLLFILTDNKFLRVSLDQFPLLSVWIFPIMEKDLSVYLKVRTALDFLFLHSLKATLNWMSDSIISLWIRMVSWGTILARFFSAILGHSWKFYRTNDKIVGKKWKILGHIQGHFIWNTGRFV